MIPSDVLFYTRIFLISYVSLCVSKDHHTNHCKNLVESHVKNGSLPCNYTWTLTKEDRRLKNDLLTCKHKMSWTINDGTKQEVYFEMIEDGVIETVFIVRCCDSYFENDKHGRCKGHRTSKSSDDDHTVLIAVVLPLGMSTFVLFVCIVARERCHRSRKRKKQKSGQLPSKDDVADCVDPEPVYFEIKDEDVISESKFEYKPNPPERSKDGNVIQNYTDNQRNNNGSEECGYLNQYTGLRFARSETNIYRDRKAQAKGEYDVIYSIAKSIHRSESDIESNKTPDESKVCMDEESKRISQNMKRETGEDHVYFVLEKVNQEIESQDTEQEKLYSRRSKSSA